MLSAVNLARRGEFTVDAVTCRSDHTGWTGPENHDDYRIVLVRSGRFRRRVPCGTTDIDRTTAYLGVPDQADSFSHPYGGDLCTSLHLSPSLWRDVAGDAPRMVKSWLYVDARLDLAHRRLVASAREDVDYAAAEELLGLLAGAVRQTVAGTVPMREADPAAERLVARAREAIDAGAPEAHGLLPLAGLLGVSPYRLSRAFTAVLGVSLTRYRNRVRVGRAVDRIEGGQRDLAALAAELGFADQAHLTRTVRQHAGRTPTGVRELLG